MFIATLALIQLQNMLLLGEKLDGKFKGLINGPGGVQEPGETLLECLLRECMEEFRISLYREQVRHLAVLNCYAAGILDFQVHVYWTDSIGGIPQETTAMRPHWAFCDELPYDKMHPGDRYWIPQALDHAQFNANLYYKEPGRGFQGIEFLSYDPTV